jgi:FkbM family methyltransferase
MGVLGSAKRALLAPLRMLDVAVIRQSSLDNLRGRTEDLRKKLQRLQDKHFIEGTPKSQRDRLSELLAVSSAQLRQDLFVLSESNFKRNGYFVEFGACEGITISNTLLLERQFGWEGILAEPCRAWHSELKGSRRAHISTKCVWSKSGEELTFVQAPSPVISTIGELRDSDGLGDRRKRGRSYQVETISLIDLLSQFEAPREIDYLSIDTEGSELEILKAFDFSRYRIGIITVEHNFMPVRSQIFELLTLHGYVRKYEDVSLVDDWYVLAD